MTGDKEQKLKDAAEKAIIENMIHEANSGLRHSAEYYAKSGSVSGGLFICIRKIIINIAKSEAAREYWASEQAKEIERLKEEINIHANNALLLSNERLLFQEENEKMREVIKKDFEKKIISEIECEKQISELKSQLEAKAVDV